MSCMAERGRANSSGPVRQTRPLCPAALLLLVFGVGGWPSFPASALGQEVPPPSARVQVPGTVPAPPVNDPRTGSVQATPGAAWGDLPPAPGLALEPDGFAKAELAVVFPHLSSLLTAPVQLGDSGPATTVALRNARLNATVAPLIQVGAFRFGPGYGELALTYQFLATEGTDLFLPPGAVGLAVRRSRLDLQAFSFDYLRNDCLLPWGTALSWEAGVRLQVVFFDTQEQTAALYEQARNSFFGFGPHAGVCLTRALPSGMKLFGRFDTALVVGYNTAQNFVVTTTDPRISQLSGAFSQEQTELSPSFVLQVGMAWSPNSVPGLRFRGGYQFQQWYNLGRVAGSRGDLNAHGLFVQGECGF
jgi:Legionella pneumophila major outer membrane protein precursor